MELSDRETLIKLEQQLQNSNQNQNQIIEAQGVIFSKIDKQSKEIFDLKTKLHTISETTILRKEQMDFKIKNYEDDVNELKRDNEKRKSFEDKTEGSLRTFKWLVGLGMFIVGALQLAAFIYFSVKGN